MKSSAPAAADQDGSLAAASGSRLSWLLAGFGLVALAAAAALRPSAAQASAAQDWSPFVLVGGLLLIGLVADEDGLFAAAGNRLARGAPNGAVLYVGVTAIVGLVTALLNLDTSVAFLTPVLVYAARSRGEGEAPLLYGCLLMSNAGSLFLPGSNLTNLIVVGHLHLTGGQFLSRSWLAALTALIVTALVVAVSEHRALRIRVDDPTRADPPVLGLGALAVVAATVVVLTLRTPAVPVAAVGVAAAAVRLLGRKDQMSRIVEVLGAPVLVGLFGVAVGLGTLGRVWTGPATLLSHLDLWGIAGLAALSSVLLNNLPAASLLAARVPPHPFALLVGLNLGPNLFATGSLAWFLWMRGARSAGSQPSIAKASRLAVVAAPLSIAAAVGALILTGSR